ncbi:hypothetical protein JYU34_017498 [Plutella xylostella]|uniref:Uncharacterized protein n=1 Tax=Plutella xylostella TaxID=51655 RepID=A0ABQ7Q1B9_PLUXY|nr:hypothetical protein JYU34_017498 [Plutella xylostella]
MYSSIRDARRPLTSSHGTRRGDVTRAQPGPARPQPPRRQRLTRGRGTWDALRAGSGTLSSLPPPHIHTREAVEPSRGPPTAPWPHMSCLGIPQNMC